MYKNPMQAYEEAGKSGMSGRDIEAHALTKAALALKECQKAWDNELRDEMLANALKLNQRLWSIFQAELTKADNPLPRLIKKNILRLSVFIDKRSIQVLANPEKEALNIIISINENLAAGLRQKVEAEADANEPDAITAPAEPLSMAAHK